MTGKPLLAGLYIRLPFDEVHQASWTPDDPDNVDVGLVIDVGWEGEQGTTLFHARVATPSGLKQATPMPTTDRIVSTRALFVMSQYDGSELERQIRRTLELAARRDTMEEMCAFLNRYWEWEYQDYEPSVLDNILYRCTADGRGSKVALFEILEEIRLEPDHRNLGSLRRDLSELYRYPKTDWIDLLWREGDLEAFNAASQNEAKTFVTENIWNVLFPAESPPGPDPAK